MRFCTGTKSNGEPCTQTVEPPKSYCWHHDPESAERRRRAASRGGSSKPSREVKDMKEAIRAIIAEVKSGDLERGDAAVMVQAYRAIRELIELERRVKETDQLAAEVEELKRLYGLNKAG